LPRDQGDEAATPPSQKARDYDSDEDESIWCPVSGQRGQLQAKQEEQCGNDHSHAEFDERSRDSSREALRKARANDSSHAPRFKSLPKFTVRVWVPTLGEATAEGTSKQEAETAAAAALLNQLQ
jgi:hypothetical protein